MTRLFVSDLDGTLLNKNAELTSFARATLGTILSQGVAFTIASARSIASIRMAIGNLPLQLPIIELNGAYITNFQTGEHLVCHALDPEVVALAVREGVGRGVPPMLSAWDGSADVLYAPPPVNEDMIRDRKERRERGDPRLREVETLDPCLGVRTVCVTHIGREEDLQALDRCLTETLGNRIQTHLYENPYSPGWYWYTLHDRAANKANALRSLAAMLEVAPEEITTFGDEINDVALLTAAGRGIAVANAIPAVKAVASEVIGPHTEDAVPRFLAEFACPPEIPVNQTLA